MPFLQIAFFGIPLCVLPFYYASLRDAFLRFVSLRDAFLCVASLRYAVLRVGSLRVVF